MVVPLLLIAAAVAGAGVVAYGTQPGWAAYRHGLGFIIWSRRLEWPLVTLSLLLCVTLIALVIAGRRRAWWLIGLGPVLALFLHHYQAGRAAGSPVAENLPTLAASEATFLQDDDYVVGVVLGDVAYAYPYAMLFRTPVVFQSDHDRRMIVLWSAYANRVLAFHADGDLKARDLELVSMPANAPLIYNSRLGQFVNALKGQTTDGRKPTGFGAALPTTKAPWKDWRDAHPTTRVVWTGVPPPAGSPTRAILPVYPAYGLPAATGASGANSPAPAAAERVRVAVVGTTQPAAVDAASLDARPFNLHADGEPVFVFRATEGGPARAFGRRFGDDIRSRFEPALRDVKHPAVAFRDVDAEALWSVDGVAVGGTKAFVGKRLTAVPVDEDVDWAVLKYWYPDLAVERPVENSALVAPVPTDVPTATRPAGRRGGPRRAAPPKALRGS